MKNMKHTPGPWNTIKRDRLTEIRPACSPLPVVNWQGFDDSNRPLDEHRANARLIAAAPDLLEVCRKTLEALNDWNDGGQPAELLKLIQPINAAIAKSMVP